MTLLLIPRSHNGHAASPRASSTPQASDICGWAVLANSGLRSAIYCPGWHRRGRPQRRQFEPVALKWRQYCLNQGIIDWLGDAHRTVTLPTPGRLIAREHWPCSGWQTRQPKPRHRETLTTILKLGGLGYNIVFFAVVSESGPGNRPNGSEERQEQTDIFVGR
jgi:hypothetical protein